MDYQSALAYISSFGRFGSRPGLERMQWVLDQLGHPEAGLKFIHVAGTNGKGSTTVLIHNILQAAGYRVGMYTSPYLESFTNRIGAEGRDIQTEALVSLVERLRPHFEAVNQSNLGPITQFEVTTLLALAYYQELGLDFVVWEVGLGGRLDATNVVTPLISVITNVGYDHTEVLGETLGQIAAEKAGIIKPKIPVVTAVQREEP
ncbi:MAG TPA: bifunctional folylpolyglutamate synthase/dihydrofolate synthase, partial [Firmicutes bacterium]|nr:bifunctional folylpolyglutamate synthase/dihydrofolate synthase [Bacillota bacterium]